MIKLNNIDKKFNKNKANELHVLKNISFELPDTGLVTLLGTSGSGKTTLLNVIGGLDKASGTIDYDGQVVNKYNAATVDKIRSKDIGYVFQNYLLLNDKSISDNIALNLKLVGINNDDIIDARIDHSLSAVGLAKYKRRKVSQLSGGQQQRVSIARALAKNPKIIIADEPTGNLDSENTIEIMNIFKNISKTRLVILVTHNQKIANYYSDKIYKISDGKIEEELELENTNGLEYKNDRNIYLLDLEHKNINTKNLNIDYYFDTTESEVVKDIRIIYNKGVLYLNIEDSSIKIINNESEVNILEEHYVEKPTQYLEEDFFDNKHYSDDFENKKEKLFFKSIKNSLLNFTNVKIRYYISYIIYFIIGIIMAFMLSSISGSVDVNTKDSTNFHPSAYILTDKEETKITDFDKDIVDYISNNNVEFDFNNGHSFNIYSDNMYQNTNVYYVNKVSIVNIEKLNNKYEVLAGSLTNAAVVVDEYFAKKLITILKVDGLASMNDLIGLDISSFDINLTIDAVVEAHGNIMYAPQEFVYDTSLSSSNYSFAKNYEVISGAKADESKDEVVIGKKYAEANGYSIGDKVYLSDSYYGFNNIEAVVSGLYDDSKIDVWKFYCSSNITKKTKSALLSDTKALDYSLYLDDEMVDDFKELGYNAVKAKDYVYSVVYAQVFTNIWDKLIPSIIIIGVMTINIYFLMRTRTMNKVYEIGVYRALGAKKRRVLLTFFTDALVILLLTLTVGFGLTTGLIIRLSTLLIDIVAIVHFNFIIFMGGYLLIFVLAMIFALLPIFNILKKTPSEIISKFDI